MGDFRKEIRTTPRRIDEVTSLRIDYHLIGEDGAVNFSFRVWDNYLERGGRFMALDIGSHTRAPHYEGHEPMDGQCHILKTKCYYDGSALQAESILEGFLSGGGEEFVWSELEKYYRWWVLKEESA